MITPDLATQDQPSDSADEFAEALARYIRRYPSRHIPLHTRVSNLSCVADDELERLLPMVEYFLVLEELQ